MTRREDCHAGTRPSRRPSCRESISERNDSGFRFADKGRHLRENCRFLGKIAASDGELGLGLASRCGDLTIDGPDDSPLAADQPFGIAALPDPS
jgi:hypothetical protein